MNPSDDDKAFEALLDYLKRSRGFDFSGYKRSSFQRRVQKQMHLRGVACYEDYIDYLEVHPEEFVSLFNTVLINVTSFFRDTAAWSYLQEQVLPSLLQAKPANAPIRIWSVGCASGEEAYTVAMILTELLGASEFRQRVKIYATDVDEEALAQARHATYSQRDLEPLPTGFQERYFELVGDRYTFRADLRRVVILGRHDLVQDAPISRLDLLVCRNTLMYFNAEAQTRILSRLHFALRDTGVLFLGKAEMLLTHTDLFTPLNLSHRIFAKVPKLRPRDPFSGSTQTVEDTVIGQLSVYTRLRELVFNTLSVAQIVMDKDGKLVLANALARSLFGLHDNDLGSPLQNLELSYRPLELRSRIEHAYGDGRSLTVNDVARYLPDGAVQYLDVRFTPLQEDGDRLGMSISFTDVTQYHALQTELQRSSQELETANEELQSSNEELETTNEELQSTNEELETTNEELQSTNSELQAINDELHQRTNEANQANAFLQSILASIRAGVVVMDNQFNVLSWNKQTENLWGLSSDEVAGQSFFSLEIGLPVDQLSETIRRCIAGADQLESSIDAVNRRGRSFRCHVTCNPLIGAEQVRQGVILIMEEVAA
ncbi:CheR family methyltransferase [Stenomitos frigidus]|uniref:protein-glutamate O-methyltransferase n=1 Tax=Stenomitos frigidus ULC18 TaxID=2107698 RepID=A0A2T1E7A8_9CYAN|nr:CheR family methyltransferase [Stenomitos frigidus]PSB28626.1 chemotaxis protein CheR [Stenomitos frigidus ULC18]